MYLKELTTFITVAEQGSFLQAAQKLYTTPASVMNQMNKLEGLIGVKLLERTHQGVGLTAAGKSIYQDGKQLLELAEAAVRRAKQAALAEQYLIRIGTSILRPCKRLIDLWGEIDDGTLPFQIRLVPFDDAPAGLAAVLAALGKEIDCFVGPCDSSTWRAQHSILLLEKIPCRLAVPRKHRLARKKSLTWEDVEGESLMLVRRGDSPVLNALRDDILAHHPRIKIVDLPNLYDTSVFNECERLNYLMESMDIWAEVHPSLLTLPMAWDYQMPYGLIYGKQPSVAMEAFVDVLRKHVGS